MTAYERRISDWSSDVCSSDRAYQPTGVPVGVGAMLLMEVDGNRDSIAAALHAVVAAAEGPGLVELKTADSTAETEALWACRKALSTRASSVQSGSKAYDTRRSKRSEEHTSELQSLMRISYAVFCLKKKKTNITKLYLTNNRQSPKREKK